MIKLTPTGVLFLLLFVFFVVVFCNAMSADDVHNAMLSCQMICLML